MSKIEDVRNKFKFFRDLVVSFAAGLVVVSCINGFTYGGNKPKDNNDGRFKFVYTTADGGRNYETATGYRLLVDSITGINYICYESGGCSPLFTKYGDIIRHEIDADWRRKDY